MLTENDIISLLTTYLENSGYKISQSLSTTQKGIDVIAENNNHILYIEAKGETSSREKSNRYGNAFNLDQIKSHVSRAILAAMKVLNDKPAGPKTKAAIALPDTAGHRKLLKKISNPLKTLGIKCFFVSEGGVTEFQ